MAFLLKGASIVILAKNHNPSIVSKEWLAQKKILDEQIVSFTHLPVVSIIETNNFNLLVDQNRLQLSVKKINLKNFKALPKIISKYIKQLPETPYTGIGFNYSYHLETAQEKLKDIFLINDKRLIGIFSEDYTFGGIIKFAFGDFTVTLTIQSISNTEIKGDFNFHFGSSEKDEIVKKLPECSETKRKAEEILEGLFYD